MVSRQRARTPTHQRFKAYQLIRNTLPSKPETDANEPSCSQPPRQKPPPLSSIKNKRCLWRSPGNGNSATYKKRLKCFRFFSIRSRGVHEFNLGFSGEPQEGRYESQLFWDSDHNDNGFVDQRSPLCTDYSQGNRSLRLHSRTDPNVCWHLRHQSACPRGHRGTEYQRSKKCPEHCPLRAESQ